MINVHSSLTGVNLFFIETLLVLLGCSGQVNVHRNWSCSRNRQTGLIRRKGDYLDILQQNIITAEWIPLHDLKAVMLPEMPGCAFTQQGMMSLTDFPSVCLMQSRLCQIHTIDSKTA